MKNYPYELFPYISSNYKVILFFRHDGGMVF